jgi:hypothetical protein
MKPFWREYLTKYTHCIKMLHSSLGVTKNRTSQRQVCNSKFAIIFLLSNNFSLLQYKFCVVNNVFWYRSFIIQQNSVLLIGKHIEHMYDENLLQH